MLRRTLDQLRWRDEGARSTNPFEEEAYAVATVLQHLAGVAYFGPRERFEAAMRQVAASLPDPPGALESLWLREKLMNASIRAGQDFHQNQGCDPAGCPMPPVERSALQWNTPWITPRAAFVRSFARFLRAFDSRHREIGLPVRTAKLLRRSWQVTRTIADVALKVGCSKSRMEALFTERYGLTPHAYHTRVRLRAAVLHLHRTADKIEYVARRVGYANSWSFYVALERYTGMAPKAVRGIERARLECLLEERLLTDVAALYDLSRGRRSSEAAPGRGTRLHRADAVPNGST